MECVIPRVAHALRTYGNHASVVAACLAALINFVRSPGIVEAVLQQGVLSEVVTAASLHVVSSEPVAQTSSQVFVLLSEVEPGRLALHDVGALHLMLATADAHPAMVEVQEAFVNLAANLAADPVTSGQVLASGAVPRVLRAMDDCPSSSAVQIAACVALRNLASSTEGRLALDPLQPSLRTMRTLDSFPAGPEVLLPACAALHNLVLSPGEARVVLQHGGVQRLLRAMKECGYRRPIAVSGLTTLLALCLAAASETSSSAVCSPSTAAGAATGDGAGEGVGPSGAEGVNHGPESGDGHPSSAPSSPALPGASSFLGALLVPEGLTALFHAMDAHPRCLEVQEAGCQLIRVLAVDRGASEVLATAGAPLRLTRAMSAFPDSLPLHHRAVGALYNLCAAPQSHEAVASMGAVQVLVGALQRLGRASPGLTDQALVVLYCALGWVSAMSMTCLPVTAKDTDGSPVGSGAGAVSSPSSPRTPLPGHLLQGSGCTVVDTVLDALTAHWDSGGVVAHGLRALLRLLGIVLPPPQPNTKQGWWRRRGAGPALDPPLSSALLRTVDVCVAALPTFQDSTGVQQLVSLCIARLGTGSPACRRRLGAAGCRDLVRAAAKGHVDNCALQAATSQALAALR